MKHIEVEIFFPSGVCSCSTEVMREQMEKIRSEIKKKHQVEVDFNYFPVHAKRAWELGVTRADTVVINEEIVLEGGYNATDILKEIQGYITR